MLDKGRCNRPGPEQPSHDVSPNCAVGILLAGLLAVLVGGVPSQSRPAAAFELGGGYHHAVDLGGYWFTIPYTPSAEDDKLGSADTCSPSKRWQRGDSPPRLIPQRRRQRRRAPSPPGDW